VIFSLHTSAYMNHSIMLADKVQRNLVRNTHLADRTVKPGGFWVLYKVAMPSILIELGFMYNAVQEEYLIKPSSQDVMAVSIYNAFVEYRNALDGTNKPLLPLPKVGDQEKSVATADAGVAPEPYKPAPKADADVAADPVKPQPKADADVAADPVKPQPKVDADVAADPVKPAPKQDAGVAADPVKPQPKTDVAVAAEPAKPAPQTETKPAPQTSATSAVQHKIRFRVQIAAIPENVSVTDSRFNKVKDVRKFQEGKLWKYTSGNATTLEEAQELLKSVKPYFSDAFIIAFDGETKIPVSQAVERLK
ncbi:MAG: N-acetylmuramoyl-L-alanine amidase, partial [Bacteroidales bacterium]|nr:N-acetylmuramoyl-L-alanine amidase [Bacteroidales bacterium]